MAVTHRVDTQKVADFLVDAIGSDPIVEDIYLRVDDRIGIWILTSPVSMEEMHHLYEPVTGLYQRFTGTSIDFHVVNPRHFLDDVQLVGEVIPPSARRVHDLQPI